MRSFCATRYINRVFKSKNHTKLNSTEMDFWRRSARISRKDKIRNNIIKQKLNMTRSVLEDIKPNNCNVRTCPKNGGGETIKKSTEMVAIRKKKTRWT